MDINFNGPTFINNFNANAEKGESPKAQQSSESGTEFMEVKDAAKNKVLPAELDTPEAIRLMDLARMQGWLDENYQPTLKTKEQVALLASRLSSVLWRENRWSVFQSFWGQKNMAQAFQNGLENNSQKGFYSQIIDVIK